MKQHDLLVIGAGPGGYVAAIRGAQLGLDTACVEAEPRLGGTCLRVGCIPSKALLESSERLVEARHDLARFGVRVENVELDLQTMMGRKDEVVKNLTDGIAFLFKKNKVTRYTGHARFIGAGRVQVGEEEIGAKNIVIATGSKPSALRGIEFDYDIIGTSTEALSYPSVPEHMVVIGGGVIGLELGSVWNRLGAKVTVLEYFPAILPGVDKEIANEALKIFTKQGLEFRLNTKVLGAKVVNGKAHIEIEGAGPMVADRVLVATGRVPNTDGLELQAVGLQTDNRGMINVNTHYQTATEGIYAIGDVIAGPMLAHKAEEEGVAVVEFITSGYGHVNYNAIPGVVYTDPEIAWVGQTEEELQEAGIPFKKGVFPFLANGRARALGLSDGRVKMLSDTRTDRILGVHIIGSHAGDLIAEAVTALEFGATSEDLRRVSHAHPTLAETLKEAALAAEWKAIHV